MQLYAKILTEAYYVRKRKKKPTKILSCLGRKAKNLIKKPDKHCVNTNRTGSKRKKQTPEFSYKESGSKATEEGHFLRFEEQREAGFEGRDNVL